MGKTKEGWEGASTDLPDGARRSENNSKKTPKSDINKPPKREMRTLNDGGVKKKG